MKRRSLADSPLSDFTTFATPRTPCWLSTGASSTGVLSGFNLPDTADPAVPKTGRVLDRVPCRVASSASPRVAAFHAAAAAVAVEVPRPAAPSGAAQVEAAGAPPAVHPGGVGINPGARKGNGDRPGGAAKTSDAGRLGVGPLHPRLPILPSHRPTTTSATGSRPRKAT